ncbi:624_t:CDS:2, partial [Dentiscutata erythropus]
MASANPSFGLSENGEEAFKKRDESVRSTTPCTKTEPPTAAQPPQTCTEGTYPTDSADQYNNVNDDDDNNQTVVVAGNNPKSTIIVGGGHPTGQAQVADLTSM